MIMNSNVYYHCIISIAQFKIHRQISIYSPM
nr:MAG TPA: hypothetical protein [Caudoviricetes sp.]DAU88345.1 MAG TPA: hypothetical protein [Caudoviricetes sp.]